LAVGEVRRSGNALKPSPGDFRTRSLNKNRWTPLKSRIRPLVGETPKTKSWDNMKRVERLGPGATSWHEAC